MLARLPVVVQIANAFGDQGNRFVVLPPEDRYLYRLAERLWKLIQVVMAKDSWRFHEHSAAASQALSACRPSSRHRLLGAAATPSRAFTIWTRESSLEGQEHEAGGDRQRLIREA